MFLMRWHGYPWRQLENANSLHANSYSRRDNAAPASDRQNSSTSQTRGGASHGLGAIDSGQESELVMTM